MAAAMADNADHMMEDVCCELCGGNAAQAMFVVRDSYDDNSSEFPVVRCKTCRLVYVTPRPTSQAISAFYPAEYYDREVFHTSAPPSTLLWLEKRRLKDIGRFVSAGRILDVGCGAGQFLAAAKASGWTTCGVEISSLAAEYARKHYGLEVLEDDLLSAALPDEHFDVVTMWGALEHLHHPKAALQEVSRILRPGGLFVALLPNINSTQARIFGARWHLLDVPRHLYHFSEVVLTRLARCAGLRPLWVRFYAREHDAPNLIHSLEAVLYPDERGAVARKAAGSGCERTGWTWRRVLMGALRRMSPVLARVMAGRRSSAAMEAYFVKPSPDCDEQSPG